MSFLEKIKASRYAELLYLVHGINKNEACWHYILVHKDKLPMFKVKLQSPHIDLTQYGQILKSGWGENPPAAIAAEIIKQYGS